MKKKFLKYGLLDNETVKMWIGIGLFFLAVVAFVVVLAGGIV